MLQAAWEGERIGRDPWASVLIRVKQFSAGVWMRCVALSGEKEEAGAGWYGVK